MFRGVSLDQAPPFEAPLKYFLTAPVFLIVGGLFSLINSDYSLYSPKFFANIHTFTIGFMIFIVFGAMQQMLPVVAGAVIKQPKIFANVTYIFLLIGTIFYISGFYFDLKSFLFISSVSLIIAVIFFSSIVIINLVKIKNKSYIIKGMILSFINLFVAVFAGSYLLINHSVNSFNEFYSILTILHYNYIAFGFLFTLIASITFQVLPMFWVAESFTQIEQKGIIYGSNLALILLVINEIYDLISYSFYKLVISSFLLSFALIAIRKLKNRKRKLKDFTVDYFFIGFIFLILFIIVWNIIDYTQIPYKMLGVLFGFGFVISIMIGMLYKIIPFLTWFHLSNSGVFAIPTMRDMIPQKFIKIQFFSYLVSIVVLILGLILKSFVLVKVFGLIFLISSILLIYNLIIPAKIYLSNKN